jgi:hypothetical protein
MDKETKCTICYKEFVDDQELLHDQVLLPQHNVPSPSSNEEIT